VIFEDQHWPIHEVVRKTFLLHDDYITYYGLMTSMYHLHVYWLIWTSPLEGTFKLNVYGSFLEDSLCLGAGDVIHN
jgi:hypothetical protein